MVWGFTGATMPENIGTWSMKLDIKKNSEKSETVIPVFNCTNQVDNSTNNGESHTYMDQLFHSIGELNQTEALAEKNGIFKPKHMMCSDGFNNVSNTITGDYFSKEFRSIEIELNACFGKEKCASPEAVAEFMENNMIQVFYKDTYNDRSD